jgi:hypothetical protein
MQGLPHSKLVLDTDEPIIHHDNDTDINGDSLASSSRSLALTPQLRKFVPENYGVIYDHLIRNRRTLAVPIPLNHVVSKLQLLLLLKINVFIIIVIFRLK